MASLKGSTWGLHQSGPSLWASAVALANGAPLGDDFRGGKSIVADTFLHIYN